MASSRPIIAPERSRRGRKYTASPLAIKAHLCYTPVIAYDFCRERLPGVKEHMRELEGEFKLAYRAKFAEAAVDSEGNATHKIVVQRG